jgi:hypothetical protein
VKYTQSFKEALQQVREDGHTDVASAVRQCKTTIEDASQMLSKLQGMNPEDNLPSWWMNKIAIAANSMNKLRDYLLVPSTNEAKEEPVVEPKEDKSAGEIQTLKNKIQQLELDLKIEKDKTVKPEPNPDTGEIPLRTGLAAALLDKNAKNKPELKSTDKKKLKMSLGKSKVEINPDVEIGVYSGGKATPSGNLH